MAVTKLNTRRISRKFQWTSSIRGNPHDLDHLNECMTWFYGQSDGRELYQEMLNAQDTTIEEDSVNFLMPKYIADLKASSIVEVGCGNGRIYRQLCDFGYKGKYTGIEVAEYITDRNRKQHPEANWQAALSYNMPFSDASFDVCFSYYVIEHFVYPERALLEMLRVLKPNGKLILVFPDFSASGRFPSQLLGFSPGMASAKMKSHRWLDALVSLYDSRLRLPYCLKNACKDFGGFPINLLPVCLSYPQLMGHDIDAVYIASKDEIHSWALAQDCTVEYPYGVREYFRSNAFMVLTKP